MRSSLRDSANMQLSVAAPYEEMRLFVQTVSADGSQLRTSSSICLVMEP